MKRVASLYLPHWAIDRVRRADRPHAPSRPDAPHSSGLPDLLALKAAGDAEQGGKQCDAPRNTGWRPGARWARSEMDRQIAAMPAHQRPPMRELGRRSEAADHPFKLPTHSMAPDPRSASNGENRAVTVPRHVVASVRSHGEGVRRGSNDPHPAPPGVAPFFDTARSTADMLARACRGEPGTAPHRTAPPGARPLVTVHKIGGRVEIAAACPTARGLGLVCGMALTQARASVPDLDVRDADPDGDHADLTRLATTLARRWSPVVAFSDADGLFVDMTGVAHLHGGEAAMARRLVRLLARLGVTARVAVADTAGAAWGAVRFGFARHPDESWSGGVMILPSRAHIAAIAPLPPEALRLDGRAIELLRRFGIDTIAALAALPRAPLVRRFGTNVALRIDQAFGTSPEPLDPVIPPVTIAVTRRFVEPIATAEAIAHWLGVLMPELGEALAKAGLGARALLLVADRVDHRAQVIRIGLARPTRDAAHILRLIVRRIEEIEPGYGIDALTLHVRRAEPLGAQGFDADLAAPTTPDLAPLVDTLANRIGSHRVWRHAPIESDVPERSVAPDAPLDATVREATRLKHDDIRRLDARVTVHPWHPRWPRPARLLPRPERVDNVLSVMPDGPPARFTWRGVAHRVVRGDGPERIAGEWWKRTAERHAIRDYFQVEDEGGRRFWLFRRGDGIRPETGDLSWYVHGTFA